ncbi:hypothetical protein AB685_09105 [Bacillus sp. LL01]|uniref:hypothetical protein n=1 Tax=Bacillus sp. LL01 TaxID=1665556 RepID=UPI00064D0D9D|nr:hypothetical protein [Bacillus sp. LL01]KMJ59203.1 hypothetical protein AB685_09105 [Bacillus sp. LL01]
MGSSLFYFAILFLSFIGWGVLSAHKLKLHQAIIPLFVFSAITTILFVAGLLNVMPQMVLILFVCGSGLSLYYLYLFIKKKGKVPLHLTPSTIIFFLAVMFIIILLRGVIHTHYDDFSHWGLIIKEMLHVNGLPDGRSIISFTNYPPGSATFIYYVLSIIGYSESYTFMAQGFLITACLTTLFIFSSWKRPGSVITAFAAALALFSINRTYIYTLLVDSLLGMVALAVLIIAYYYRNDWTKGVLANTPIMILLLLIKDSGKVFFLFNLVIILCFVYSYYLKGSILKRNNVRIVLWVTVFTLVLPLSMNFLWGQYVDKADQKDHYNKFAVNRGKLLDNNKTEEFRENLGPMVFQAATDINNSGIKSMLILNGLALATILIYIMLHRQLAVRLVAITFFVNIAYIIYIFTLYLMYLFLMPENEAIRLAGFSRYLATIVVYCAGILMISLYKEWFTAPRERSHGGLRVAMAAVLIIAFMYPQWENMKAITQNKPDTSDSIRWGIKDQYQRILNDGLPGPQVFYYSPESFEDRGYLDYVLRFEQTNHKFTVLRSLETAEEETSFINRIKASQYFVLVGEDERSQVLLKDLFTEKSPSGVYRVNLKDDEVELEPIR